MPNVYTRTGDKGTTGLFGGSRTSKADIRVEAYGTMDEATSFIGLAYSYCKDEDIRNILNHLQKRILIHGAELASDERGRSMIKDPITQADIDYMEEKMDYYLKIVGEQKEFTIPGANPVSAALHAARAVVRRAERRIVSFAQEDQTIRPEILKFTNRLSDLLFVLARMEAFNADVKEMVSKVMNIVEKSDEVQPKMLENDVDLLMIAKRMSAAARVKAEDIDLAIVFTVVDQGGNLVYFERMDDALLASIDISQNKAYTANALKMSTDQVSELAKEQGSLFGIQFTNKNKIVTFGGGYPIKINGAIVGGVGVSGGTAEQDMSVAQAALKVIE